MCQKPSFPNVVVGNPVTALFGFPPEACGNDELYAISRDFYNYIQCSIFASAGLCVRVVLVSPT